jgi:hypothetical protein
MMARGRPGVTLTELMVATVILTVGVLAGVGSFKYISLAISQSRLKTIATNLAQEKMEVLKNKPYFLLLVTTQTAVASDYDPNFVYDNGSYAPETITLWGLPPLTRAVNIDYASVSGTSVSTVTYSSNDTGMKKISVYVFWTERNTPRKVQIDSYYENPSVAALNTGFKGQVTVFGSGTGLGAALVQVVGSPKWKAYADASGNYSFQVSPGSYSLVASSAGFRSMSVSDRSVEEGVYQTWSPALTRIATGTVLADSVYAVSPLPVISQVVASSVMANGFDVQYIELFNPATFQINIAAVASPPGTAPSASRYVKLGIESTCTSSPRQCDDVELVYNSTYIPAGWYYLIANTNTFVQHGIVYTADAYYSDSAGAAGTCSPDSPAVADWAPPGTRRLIRPGHNGAAWLSNDSIGIYEQVGWQHSGGSTPNPNHCNGTCIPTHGLLQNDQIVRFNRPCAADGSYARAYDSTDNANDFYYNDTGAAVGLPYGLYNSTTATPALAVSRPATFLSGIPTTGGYAFANDGNSSGVSLNDYTVSGAQGQSCKVSSLTLTGVSTGTWDVSVLTPASSGTVRGVAMGSSGGFRVKIASSTTTPVWRTAGYNYVFTDFLESGGFAVGYVYGASSDYSRRLSNILVGSSAGSVARTDAQGFYVLTLPTGAVTVTANRGFDNVEYLTSDYDAWIPGGAVATIPDFHLPKGAILKGYVTSGTGALPNISIQASAGGSVYEDTSDQTGYFYISAATSPVAYAINPVLDPLQSYAAAAKAPCTVPSSAISCAITTPGNTVFIGTFTITGAMGTIQGSVKLNGSAITTGVLILVSGSAISDPPSALSGATAPGQTPVYAVSSQADGTYSLEVRAGTSYNMRAFYPQVDANTGAVSYPGGSKTGTVTIGAGATVTGKDFSWP